MADIRAAREAYYGKKTVSRGKLTNIEMRDDGAGKITFRGYACITDHAYEVFDWLGEYDETIARGAFAKSLQEQDDTRLLVNHEGVPIARTKSGTLSLREIMDPANDPQERGQTGLWCEAPDLDASNPTVQEIRSAMLRGDISEMSFAFMATRQEWNEDWTERTVLELRLLDVSVVTYPANPATSAALSDERADAKRELVLSLLDSGRPLDDEQRTLVRAAFEERDAMATVIEPAVDAEPVDDRSTALAFARLESARADSL